MSDIKDYEMENRETLVDDFCFYLEEEYAMYLNDRDALGMPMSHEAKVEFALRHEDYWRFVSEYATGE